MKRPFLYAFVRTLRSFLSAERALVAGLLLCIAGLWGFAEIYDEIEGGEIDEFDVWVADLLRPPENGFNPVGPDWLVSTAADLTALGGTPVLVLMIALVCGYVAVVRRFGLLWLLLVSSVLGTLLNTALKLVIGRQRPDEALHLVEVSNASFPSGHAMLATIVYLTLGAVVASTRPRTRERVYVIGAAVLIAGVVGLTRVYLGVHYPTDVLAGWSVGLSWTVVCLLVAYRISRRERRRAEVHAAAAS